MSTDGKDLSGPAGNLLVPLPGARTGAAGSAHGSRKGAPIRRLVLALVLATGLGVVAAAPAPTTAEQCRQVVGDPPQACDGVGALARGAAGLCRHAADTVACGTIDGREVSEASVAAFESGDVAAVLAIQRALRADLPLRHAVFPATHNSYNSLAYTPTLSRMDANQTHTMRDQLRMGVRRLELDVHLWFAPDGSRVPVTCHATDEPNVLGDPVTRHTGCTTEETVDVALAEVAGWLSDHPDELLMLRFETHLEGADGHDALAAHVETYLGELLYRPASAGCTELPLDLTVADARRTGAQVIAVGGCGDGSRAWQAVAFDDDDVRRESTYRGEPYRYPDCGGIDVATASSSWIRWFEDATFVSSASAVGGQAPRPVTPEVARAWTRCGINQPSFDHLVPDDGRLEALVWSFTPGAQDAADGSCAVQHEDGGLHGSDCRDAHRPFVCRDDGTHAITQASGPWTAGDQTCHEEGRGEFVTPRTGLEAEQVAAALEASPSSSAWVSLRHVAGAWRLQCRPGRAAGPLRADTRPPVSCPAAP